MLSKSKKRIPLILIAALVMLTIVLLLTGRPREIYMRQRAARLVLQIEHYHSAHGKYPVSLADLGIREVNGPIYYELDFESPSVYHVWFGTGVGTVSQYDSKTRTWHGPR